MTVLQLLKQNQKAFARYILGAFITIVNGLSFTLALSNAFGIIEEPTREGIMRCVLIVAFFVVLPVVMQYISRFLRIGFMRDILIQVRMLAYQKILALSYSDYKKQSKEVHMSHLVSDINLFEQDFFLSLLNIVFCFGSFTVGSLLLLYIHPLIALVTAGICVLLYLITRYFEPLVKQAKEDTQKANEAANVEISNILNGMEIIKLFHVEQQFIDPFRQIIARLERIKDIAYRRTGYHQTINGVIASSYQLIIFVYATYLYTQDKLSLTSLVIVFNLIGQLSWTLISGFNHINRFKTAVMIYNKITKPELSWDGGQPMVFSDAIRIQDLSYTYDQEHYVLNHIDLTIPKGSRILITGPSGVGKTTLLSCLTQNRRDYEGTITVDGVDLKNISHQDFLKHCGYVRQEHFLFNDSIKNNIILEKPYDEKRFMNILKGLDLYDWIMGLEEKENHQLIQDGSNISGGQRQRISIARELYHDKEVLFIDEPSASLDDYTAKKVYDTLLALDKTIICVSHRHLDYLKDHFDAVIHLEKKGDLQ